MRADISASTSEISSIEADCAIFNPPVIREYLGATDDDKQLFEMTFKQYRANQQLIARGRFYAWKLDMLTRVGPDVEGVLVGMREVSVDIGHVGRGLWGSVRGQFRVM